MNYPNLNLLLRAANRRQLFLSLAQSFFRALVVLTLSVLIAILLDAVLSFPTWIRLAVDVVLVALALLALGRLVQVLRKGRFDSRRLARLLEQRLGMTDNALINAIDLREPSRGTTSRRLANESVQLGERAAQKVNVGEVIVGRPAQRAAFFACVALAGTALALLTIPGVFARGLPRLLAPTRNHPPFTLVSFDVQVQPEPLYYGSAVTVTAKLSGLAKTDRADLVFDNHDKGEQAQRLPMISTDEGYRLRLDRVERTHEFYIDTPKGRSDWYKMDVQQVPMFEQVWVSYEYPDYSDRAPHRHRLYGRDVEGIVGTLVSLEVSSNFPLSAGLAEIQSASDSRSDPLQFELVPDQADSRRVRGAFRLEYSGQLTLRLLGDDQQPGPEIREASVIVLADRAPSVTIVDPEPVALAVEDWMIPVLVRASDDVQLSKIQMQFRKNDGPPTRLPLAGEFGDRRHWQGRAQFDLADAGAKAGDQIRFIAAARDNRAGGQQVAKSLPHVVQVISREAYMDHLRTMYQMQQLANEINELNDRLREASEDREQAIEKAQEFQQSLTAESRLNEQQKRQLARLQETLDKYSRQSVEIREQVDQRLQSPQLYDVEQDYREQLQGLSEQLGHQQENVEQLQKSLEAVNHDNALSAGDVQRLRESMQRFEQQSEPFGGGTRSGFGETEQEARKLAQAHRILIERDRIREVVQQQRQVADHLESFRGSDRLTDEQQQRMDRLARRQERINQDLEVSQMRLRDAAERAARNLPRSSSDASRLCDSIDRMGIPEDQRQAARAARQGSAGKALEAAESASEKLESLAGHGPDAQRVAQELSEGDPDRDTGMSPQDLQKSLEQMMSHQSRPGLGSSAKDARRQRGAASRLGMHGPQPPMNAFRPQRGRRSGHSPGGQAGALMDDSWANAELIEATSRATETGGVGSLRGVPIGYREQAEAYFRRLAEEPMLQSENNDGS